MIKTLKQCSISFGTGLQYQPLSTTYEKYIGWFIYSSLDLNCVSNYLISVKKNCCLTFSPEPKMRNSVLSGNLFPETSVLFCDTLHLLAFKMCGKMFLQKHRAFT